MDGSGLVTGGTPYGEQMASPLSSGAARPPEGGYLPIVIPTVLNLTRDSLAYWQSITCLFNKWWYPEKDRVTLPFCFFHVVKYSETQKADISQKRIILYEPPEEANEEDAAAKSADPVRQSLMQTVADNVVLSPKEYKVEAAVPFMPFGRFERQGAFVLEQVMSSFGSIADSAAVAYTREQLRKTFAYGEAAQAAINFMDEASSDGGQPLDESAMINKNSLDAMFERGNVLQFKTWMGFDYKYGVLTDMACEKRGTEDDVWRVSFTLRETPVLSLARVKGSTGPVVRTWVQGATDLAGKLAFGRDNVQKEVPAFKAVSAKEEDDGAGATGA